MADQKPNTLHATSYGDGSIEAFRNRENEVAHEEEHEVTSDETADVILAVEPVPDTPPDAEAA